MSDVNKQTMQFIFGDRELVLIVADLLGAAVDVIVNPANGGLSHGGGVAGQIAQQGGEIIQKESDLFIKQHGHLESGMVAITSAGRLPYAAIIHAIGPKMGEGDEQRKIQQAVAYSLQLCDMHDWKSIAFPAISSGIFAVPIEVCARAFFRAITSYWDARIEIAPEKVIICLTKKSFKPFLKAFREESSASNSDSTEEQQQKLKSKRELADDEIPIGLVDLSAEDIILSEDEEMNDWFK